MSKNAIEETATMRNAQPLRGLLRDRGDRGQELGMHGIGSPVREKLTEADRLIGIQARHSVRRDRPMSSGSPSVLDQHVPNRERRGTSRPPIGVALVVFGLVLNAVWTIVLMVVALKLVTWLFQ